MGITEPILDVCELAMFFWKFCNPVIREFLFYSKKYETSTKKYVNDTLLLHSDQTEAVTC